MNLQSLRIEPDRHKYKDKLEALLPDLQDYSGESISQLREAAMHRLNRIRLAADRDNIDAMTLCQLKLYIQEVIDYGSKIGEDAT